MDLKSTDLISLFEQSLQGAPPKQLDQSGVVISAGDGMCRIHGLRKVKLGELIEFEGGNKGIVFDLNADWVTAFLLFNSIAVAELEVVRRTESVFTIPVGPGMLGRVLNSLGLPIDALGNIEGVEWRSVEQPIPSIVERSPIDESLETGVMVVDALVPIGRGQRELIIGNRNTGKTALALDAILHQKGKKVICVYVAIGQRQANVARTVRLLEENGALEYTIVISSDASEAVLNHYLAPYVGCTIAEYFRDQKRDVLVVYDDLTNHATSFREMSLLMRRSPGREAYPGDVFYLHSRLLERAGKLLKGGSISALPIVQVQSDDITAYIPTNLISITDGQIFLDTKLFNKGNRPAVNVELSISRVGGAAQTKAVKKMTKALRLELAQYNELLDFAQFGTELDPISQKRLARGARIIELFKQEQFVAYPFEDQSLMLYLLNKNFLDSIAVESVHRFVTQFKSYVKSVYSDLYETISSTKDISDNVSDRLHTIATEFSDLFLQSDD